MKLIALGSGWIAGIYCGSLVQLPLHVWLSLGILPALIALAWRRLNPVIWATVCLLAFLGGIAWYNAQSADPTLHPGNYSGPVEVVGEVDRDPELLASAASLSLEVTRIREEGDWREVSGRVVVYTSPFPSYDQGDVLSLSGELQPSLQPGFSATMSWPRIEVIDSGWVWGARNRLSDSLAEALPEPEASLAQALLLGDRSHVPEDIMLSFRDSGTSHLMAISGLHVGCLGLAVLGAAAWALGRRRPAYLLLALAVVWLYASLSGMRPPALRASIMFSLFLVALWLGRPRSFMPSLVLAAALMVGLDPSVLWDVSFQLSFLAVAGIVLLVPAWNARWEQLVSSRAEDRWPLMKVGRLIVYPAMVSLAACLATYPLVAYYFGYVSLTGLPATFLALMALPAAILLSLFTAVLGLLAPAVAWAVGWADWLSLGYMLGVVEGFASLPFASHEVGPVSAGVVWGYYAVLLAVLARRRLVAAVSEPVVWLRRRAPGMSKLAHSPPKKWLAVPLLIAAVLVWIAVLSTPGGGLEVSFLDVGQGDSILVCTPAGQQVLIDGGPDPEAVCRELGERMPFWDRSLDVVVLTHADDDHLLGLVEVLGRYDVGLVVESGCEKGTSSYREWRRLLDGDGVRILEAAAGQQLDLGDGLTMEILHPQPELMTGTESDVNNNSVVLRLIWREVSFLLTGDVFDEAERRILQNGYALRSTVLKVAHHGSATSSCPEFLSAVSPQVAVISVGENTFGHPDSGTLDRLSGIDVYRTDERGTITFSTDGERLWVETER